MNTTLVPTPPPPHVVRRWTSNQNHRHDRQMTKYQICHQGVLTNKNNQCIIHLSGTDIDVKIP